MSKFNAQNNLITSVGLQNLRFLFTAANFWPLQCTPTINGESKMVLSMGENIDEYGKSCNDSTKLSITCNHINNNEFNIYNKKVF